MEHFADYGITIDDNCGRDHVRASCPKCTPDRKSKNKKDLAVDLVKMVWLCHHCGWKGNLRGYSKPVDWKPKYVRPEPKSDKNFDDVLCQYLNGRGISDEVLKRNGVTTHSGAICFNYYRGGELINIKHRTLDKKFWSEKDTEHIVYGADDIELGDGSYLVWVEGEIDKLSVEMAGIKACVSVPDGAPNATAKDVKQKFAFMDSIADILKDVEKHVIAVDGDANGMRLREELIRRLGSEKCFMVKWPDGIKDANDALLAAGPSGLLNMLESAVPAPIRGVITAGDVFDQIGHDYDNGIPRGYSTGWGCVDQLYTPRPGEWTVVTGIPGHGKSEWLDALTTNMARLHGWQFAVCSPENQPIRLHVEKLLEKVVGKPFDVGYNGRMTQDEMRAGLEFINNHFSFMALEEYSLSDVLAAAKSLIVQRGINGLVIDPWNEIEGTRKPGQSETEYICVTLGMLRRFARENQIHLWIVAHPTKLPKEKADPRGPRKQTQNQYAPPTLYDISGSSHWYNKADIGICVFRNRDSNLTEIYVQKMRFKTVGRIGMQPLAYDVTCGRFRDPMDKAHERMGR